MPCGIPAGHACWTGLAPAEASEQLGSSPASRSATATALTPLKVYRLDKNGFAAAIAAMPELIVGLEAVARRGQATLGRDAGAHENTEIGRPDVFLSKLREFLRRLNG